MNKKIECIKRLFDKNNCYMEMCEWFIDLGIITDQEVVLNSRPDEKAKFIFNVLKENSNGVNCKFQLVDWEWKILPIELIKITCITENEVKEFSFGH